MKIKNRLALYFTLTSTLTLLVVLFAIYFTFLKFMESDFFDRLTDRTMVTAKLYLEADEISSTALAKARGQYLETLNGERIRIYNSENRPVFIGDGERYWSAQVIERVRKAKKLKFKDGENQVVGIFYKDNQGDFVIIASATDRSTFYRLGKLKDVMMFVFVIIFIGLLLSARWIANRILKPLDLFIDEVKQIKSSNLHFRVQEGNNKDEINLLASNFNKLMEHLEQAFVLQKTFIANASHELRTPVTSMMIGAEIVLSKERSNGEYKQALDSIMEDAEKMDSIIKELVNLAQADVEYGSSRLQDVNLKEMLISIAEEWKNTSSSTTLDVVFGNISESGVVLSANPTLLKIAINNIISNAFKFSDHGKVACSLTSDSDNVIIEVDDDGPGIDEVDQALIFEPFYSSANKPEHEGTGMGLFMARKIVQLFKGTITFRSSHDHGSTFIIRFPKF
ncbi:signal transduction histidine kinase [Arcticibacter pallidicorallinus]|uniref:histidine kinase n=1 Tax=Arcticibacter pallidicorallinus TaxID=1259464 RepID=A0A2T0U4N5_9SPHI|nr:HAMP domain-containing sensor histidine kinase [Arcticibacter pallidicorallinus]PRY52798.1 signal transduction histidine kinase [Arcticibacter pallidicorallinus]